MPSCLYTEAWQFNVLGPVGTLPLPIGSLAVIHMYLELVCPLFWGFNPPKQGLFQSKLVSFGFQVRISLIFLRVPKKKTSGNQNTWIFFGKKIGVHAVGETYSDKNLTN